MTNLLVRLFVKNSGDTTNLVVRERYGKLAGAVGIASNLLLFLLKLLVGLFSGSIAILADAVNNLSDCASSVITLAGFHLAALPPDEKHPYGHARFEYISGLAVSFLILAIGFQFLLSSVRKIITPAEVVFSTTVALILAVSILVKLWQGLFNRNIGRRIASDALRATAVDSINDVVSTSVVLAGLLLAHFTGWNLDGWFGLAVAVFILVSGVQLVAETLNPLLGTAPAREQVQQLEEKILGYESVLGLHDLVIHNYGPGRSFASAHVEVPANQDILLSHDIIDNIERDVARELQIELVVHLDPLVTDNEQLTGCRQEVQGILQEIDPALSMHDFRMVEGKTHTNLIFDVVVPPRYHTTDKALRAETGRRVRQRLGEGMYCVITIDRSYTATRE